MRAVRRNKLLLILAGMMLGYNFSTLFKPVPRAVWWLAAVIVVVMAVVCANEVWGDEQSV